MHQEANLENKKNLKIDSDSKLYRENPSNFNTSWFFCPVLKFRVSTLFRKLMKFPMTLIFRVSPDLALIRPKIVKSRNYSILLKSEFSAATDNFQRS
jgi:hypothetical protein